MSTADGARDDSIAFRAALDDVAEVDGWLRPEQARRLWEAARRVGPSGHIVEIGSYQGRSTVVLARGAGHGVTVVAIDPHAGNDRGPNLWRGTSEQGEDDHRRFVENLSRAGVSDRVTHLRLRSEDALPHAPRQIDFLYVDGAHGYRHARADIREWSERVTPAGRMLIHDAYLSVGVTAAIGRELLLGRRFRYVGRTRSLVEYERVDVRGRGYLVNVGRQLAPLPWFLRNTVWRVLIMARLGRVARLLGYRGGGMC